MNLTDFLGKTYGPDDLVIYGAMSGRSVNVIVGRVVDIYEVYRDPDSYKYRRLEPGQLAPFKEKHGWFDAEGRLVDSRPAEGGEWRGYETDEREDTYLRVKVQPLRGARWKQHHGRKRYIDTRSGKGINPDAPSGKHVLKHSHYVFADGREFDYEGEGDKYRAGQVHGARNRLLTWDSYFRRMYRINNGEPGSPPRFPLAESEAAKQQLWYVSRTYQPWVQEVSNGPEPVTLEITDNIVKWEGELPDEVPDEVS